MTKKVKKNIALIGLGEIAQKAYLPIIANHSDINPILCTRNTHVLDALSNQYRIQEAYSSIEDLIKKPLDGAMIHSSTESHYSIVTKLLNAGIPVFVDKPLSSSFKKSEVLLNLATQKQISVYVGFNRRFAPLVESLKKFADPFEIRWQKNRVNLPGKPRDFIFDDFIHVIDGLRFLAEGKIKDLQVNSKFQKDALASIQVQWQQNGTLLNGGMNRISGLTEEQIEYSTNGNKCLVENLTSGLHYTSEKINKIDFGSWKSTLYKRGFVNMIENWLDSMEEDKFDAERIKDIWETHHLCELILEKVK